LADPLIFNIQKFSIHDGAGIRTTVFFKGCPLRCAWCHNPESQSFAVERFHYPERCIGCGRCAEGCFSMVYETVGKTYPAAELCALLERDRIFYDSSGGGVTFSGGEPLAQDEAYLASVAERLSRRGIRVTIDTCGHAPYARFQALFPFVDTFLYDIKLIDDALHERYTGVSNRLILKNARRLSEDGARIHARVPVIPGVNMHDAEMRNIIGFVRENMRAEEIHLMPYHRLGQDKNERLGRQCALFDEPAPSDMQTVLSAWKEAGFENIHIGG
jgi:pyruvate formate lyase activating enzyme